MPLNLVDTLAKRLSRKAVVTYKQQIADHTFHLQIQGDDLAQLAYTPGEHLRILVGVDKPTNLQDKVRTYSIWQYNQADAIIDLAVCTHSTGIGSQWAHQVKVGDALYFGGPKGRFTVDNSADYYVMVGDPSSLAHLYELNRNLSGNKPVISLVYADRKTDLFADLDGSTPLRLYELPQNPAQAVLEQLEPQLKNQAGKGLLYVGGDSRLCVTLNHHFRQSLGWESRQIKSKPFWNPTKTGLE